jgi:hypothetical protein
MAPDFRRRIVSEMLGDLDWSDTLAQTRDLQVVRESLIGRMAEFPPTRGDDRSAIKAVVVRAGKPAESVKPFNILLNLGRLWDDLPELIADVAGLVAERSWITQAAIVLRFLRKLVALTEFQFTRDHEAVVAALAILRRGGVPVPVVAIVDVCTAAARENPSLPRLSRGRIEEALAELARIHCVRQEGAGWQLRETVLFLVSPD